MGTNSAKNTPTSIRRHLLLLLSLAALLFVTSCNDQDSPTTNPEVSQIITEPQPEDAPASTTPRLADGETIAKRVNEFTDAPKAPPADCNDEACVETPSTKQEIVDVPAEITPAPVPAPPIPDLAENTYNCAMKNSTIKHQRGKGKRGWSRTVKMPAKGRFVEESHYATTSDKFKSTWPKKRNEGMTAHLRRSCQLYNAMPIVAQSGRSMNCDKYYSSKWRRVWTPSGEGNCKYGQGSDADAQRDSLTATDEMWMGTMMWADEHKPAPGTKFLACANGRCLTLIMGYETGPGQKKFLGGVTPEVHQYLGTNNKSNITVGELKDQSLPPGPVECH